MKSLILIVCCVLFFSWDSFAQTTSSKLIVEAESGTLTYPMKIELDNNVSGGSYILNVQAYAGEAVFHVSIQESGLYSLRGRVYAPGQGNNSMLVSIDNGPDFVWDIEVTTAYDGETIVWKDNETPIRKNLEAGSHTITIKGREYRTQLDYLVLEKVGDFTPPPNISVRPSHPRLYLTDAKIAFLRDKINNQKEPYYYFWQQIKSKADVYANQTPYSADDPITRNPNTGRDIGNRLPYLAMAYVLSLDTKYLAGAKKWADAIITYPQWGSDKDLTASHILSGMSMVYDWLYDDLTEVKRSAYAAEIKRHLDITYGLLTSDGYWWTSAYHQNHNYNNTLSIMDASIALYDTLPGANNYIKAVFDNFSNVLNVLPIDGVSTEGLSYWSYGAQANVRYFHLEKEVTGIDRMQSNAFFQNTGKYRLYASVPGFETVIGIGDIPKKEFEYYGPGYILQGLASNFNDPYSQWLASKVTAMREASADHIPRVDWRNMIFYDASVPETAPYNLPTYGFFDDLGIFTSRASWEDDDAVFFAFKAGPLLGHHASITHFTRSSGHAHTGEGMFLLYGYGEKLIVDDNIQYAWLTSNHNTLTFDGGIGQLGDNVVTGTGIDGNEIVYNNGTTDIVHTDFTEDYEYLVADLAKIYKPELQITKFLRHVLFVKKKQIIVIDEVESNISHDIEWRVHINETAIMNHNNRKIIATLPSGTGLMIEDLSEQDFLRTVEPYNFEFAHPQGGGTRSFSSQLVQITPTGKSARIQTIIRPFKGALPSDIIINENNGDILDITLNGSDKIRLSTSSRSVSLTAAGSPPQPPQNLRID